MKYIQKLVVLDCRGFDSGGLPVLDAPVSVTIDLHRSPGASTIGVGPKECPHNTGGHRQRCKASHPPGVDKVGEGVSCPFSFDYPYVKEFDSRWVPPFEVAAALEEIAATPP